ncbi:MAG: type II toxin-antitoxin system VapC family toxin [Gammaproteobacteria bacterium]|nr:type II toxin-antitoxin system VapC family toxin [Gammaproteobacteria bacterium]
MMYVLDTNTVIYFFKGMGHVSENLFAVPRREVALPAIVLYELEVSIAKSGSEKRRRQLDTLLKTIRLLPFAHAEAEITAKLRAYLEQQGTPIGPLDTLIAGTALTHHGILVTRNTEEFNRVPALQVVNWYSE